MRQNYPPQLSVEPKIKGRFEENRKNILNFATFSFADDSTREDAEGSVAKMEVMRCANPELRSNLLAVLGNRHRRR